MESPHLFVCLNCFATPAFVCSENARRIILFVGYFLKFNIHLKTYLFQKSNAPRVDDVDFSTMILLHQIFFCVSYEEARGLCLKIDCFVIMYLPYVSQKSKFALILFKELCFRYPKSAENAPIERQLNDSCLSMTSKWLV